MILGIDPGRENLGWALATDDGVIERFGVICGAPPEAQDPNAKKLSMPIRNLAAAYSLGEQLSDIVGTEHGEGFAAAPRRRVITETLGMFGSVFAIIPQVLAAGVIATVAGQTIAELHVVGPKSWQKAIYPQLPPKRYDLVLAELRQHARTIGLGDMLDAIETERQQHALDAVGMAIYLAVGKPTSRVG